MKSSAVFLLSSMPGNNADNNKITEKIKNENPNQPEAIGKTEEINK